MPLARTLLYISHIQRNIIEEGHIDMDTREMKLLDMHCDTLIECWRHDDRTMRHGPGHLSLDLMLQNHGMAQFFAIYLSRIEMQTMEPYEIFQKVYDNYRMEMSRNTDVIRSAFSAEDIEKNASEGFLSAFLTIEDGVFIGDHMERLREVYDKGVRLITLIWGFPNTVGYPCSDDPEENARGLTEFGMQVIEEMNRIGLIIDVSHMSEGGFYDVAKYSKKPFMATHSCAKALCGHKRNLTDDQLRVIGETGSVVGVNFESSFLKDGSSYATVEQIMRHLDYMVNKAGIDHVGFGSDFDGIDSAGELKDYSGYSRVLAEMEKKYTDDEIDKLTHLNVLATMRSIIG
ncbi:membrane dipeptidase [Clostridiales Family XIII bacterium WCA-MUC-591-APC-3H]|uniref:Membrane dipeptidase n=3 Tax=Hornefia butyriciproducens TaxID=2652293 RepID=A0A6L5Y477_9FIRM|nr:membrane dipeptidase [Hornefia butyriciproducens]